MAQITHRTDPDTGHLMQIVPPAELRRVLAEDGDDESRPEDFADEDEWVVR